MAMVDTRPRDRRPISRGTRYQSRKPTYASRHRSRKRGTSRADERFTVRRCADSIDSVGSSRDARRESILDRATLAEFSRRRGLDTILSGRYVTVEPGPTDAGVCRFFQGLDQPLSNRFEADALEIVLEGTELHGLQVDAPVIYRGLSVGRVQSVGLSADGRWIQVRAAVDADYRNLVRANSRFWNRSGFRIEVGLSGVNVDAESLAGISAGGIEFATPDPPGETVKAGRRFELAAKAEEEWKAWQPRLLHGNQALEGLGELPFQERLTATWKVEFLLRLQKNASRKGWILALDDGTLIGPRDLFEAPPSALAGTMSWEMKGKEWTSSEWKSDEPRSGDASLSSDANPISKRYARGKLSDLPSDIARWPVKRIAAWKPSAQLNLAETNGSKPAYPLWIVGDVPNRRLPIERHQIDVASGPPWKLDPSIGLDEDRHGSAVIDGQTGNLIGIVDVAGTAVTIVPIR